MPVEHKTNSDLVEVRPLRPFVGTYRCELKDADMIDDGLVEKDGGLIVKEKVPKKRYIGLVSVRRAARPDELELISRGEALPEGIELADDVRSEAEKRVANKGQIGSTFVFEHPAVRTLMLPREVASKLVSRGLAEIVMKVRRA